MITWLTIQMHQFMFGVRIDSETLSYLQGVGFTEMAIETILDGDGSCGCNLLGT